MRSIKELDEYCRKNNRSIMLGRAWNDIVIIAGIRPNDYRYRVR